MNKFLLSLVMLPSDLWKSLGADLVQLRAILQTRLTLDDRNPVAIGRIQKQKKDRKYGTLMNTVIYAIMGFIYALPLMVIHDRILSLTVYFTLLLTVLTFMLITDFSNVLFDSRDKYILFPRPVTDRTLVLSRMLHVFIYLLRIIVPFSAAGWVMLSYRDGWTSGVLFPLPLVLLVFMVLFLVNTFYLLVLRLSKPERFKDVINYFQVVTSVIFFASVYFLPRLFDTDNPREFSFSNYPGIRYVPSYWLASCWSWIGFGVPFPGTAMYSVLAVMVPVICMYVMVKQLAPQFARRIAGIDAVEYAPAVPATGKGAIRTSLYRRMATILNKDDEARAGFIIAWLQTSRSRTFRMRVYPSIAFIPIYFVYILTQHQRSLSEAYRHLADKPKHLLALYMSSFLMISALNYLAISDQYKAAWVYESTPVATPGNIMAGAFKAVLFKFFIPFYAIMSVVVLYIWGAPAIWDILLAFVNVCLFVVSYARLTQRFLPFSLMEQIRQSGGRIFKSFIVMLFPMILGFGHFISVHLLWLKLIFLLLSCMLLWLVWTSFKATSWSAIVRADK